MPKRKSSSQREGEDGDPEEGASVSQAHGAEQLQDMSPEIKERLVRDVFRHMLFCHTKRTPVARAEIKKVVGVDYKLAVQDMVLSEVVQRFEAVMGFEMVEVQTRKGAKSYILQASNRLLDVTTLHASASAEDGAAPEPWTPLAPAPHGAASIGLLNVLVSAIALAKGEVGRTAI